MASGGGDENKNKALKKNVKNDVTNTKVLLKKLCECDNVVSTERIKALGRITDELEDAEENISSEDEIDETLETEYHMLNDKLDLPEETYSLTKIHPNLPRCVKFGIRTGRTHLNMRKFSPLSRGLQGPSIAVAAYATNALLKARCWNELVIDQIVEDGDTHFCESYKNIVTDDRRTLTILDLKRDMTIQNSHITHFSIDDPVYVGTFRSENPTEMHLMKALDLFFKRYDAGILTSRVLNIAIWRDSKFFNIFDGQARQENCEPAKDRDKGAAMLILVKNLTGVAFIILEKSNVNNEPFVLYGIAVDSISELPLIPDDPLESNKILEEPKRIPSGYIIQTPFRALVRGSYHLRHSAIPEEFRGRSHLVIALAAVIYSRLVNANKWNTATIDLIFNQAHIYLVDLARVLEKKLDNTLELEVDDLIGDVILGVYAAKVKVDINVIPGQGKKGKATIDTGLRDFFQTNVCGILEVKKTFYAIWKEGNKYYLLDPFACDEEGFRVDPDDAELASLYNTAVACLVMNSSINEMVETILENTESTEKDPFIIHGINVLYVKTGTILDGPLDRVIYREKKTNRRPQPSSKTTNLSNDPPNDDCKVVVEMTPKLRPDAERSMDKMTQFPELMSEVESYMMSEVEPRSFVVEQSELQQLASGEPHKRAEEESHEAEIEISNSTPEEEMQYVTGYTIINPHRLLLQGWKHCLADDFEEDFRGRQGSTVALTAMAYAKIKHPSSWRSVDVDQIIDIGHEVYKNVVTWIRQGKPEEKKDAEEEAKEGEDEEEEEEEEEDEETAGEKANIEEDATAQGTGFKGVLLPAPEHLDLSMIPDKIKMGENEVTFKKKMNIAAGRANPLANLGECLEQYFSRYSELIIENKKLMYGVWTNNGKYFVFNPYGGDEEGQRVKGYPASFTVTDTINELTDVFYGVLEFNDPNFTLHLAIVDSIQPDDKYLASNITDIPEEDSLKKYEIEFLPVTDEDLYVPDPEPEPEPPSLPAKENVVADDDEDKDDEEEEEEEEEDTETEAMKENEKEVMKKEEESPEEKKPLEDPLLEVQEQDQPDPPEELNFFLLTANIILKQDQPVENEFGHVVAYEKLKYQHPPPYVLPPRKVLCTLLESKHATASMHSLISRFSIDSKLQIKTVVDLPDAKPAHQPTIETIKVADEEKTSKLITIPPKKYFVSRIYRIGYTPLRAVNDKFIQDEDLDRAMEEECKKKRNAKPADDMRWEEAPEVPTGLRIKPTIIALGPVIKTQTPKKKPKPCLGGKKRKCKLSENDREDDVLERLVCKTEDVIFNMIFPSDKNETKPAKKEKDPCEEKKEKVISNVKMRNSNEKSRKLSTPEESGFEVSDESIGIIVGNMCLENRAQSEQCHFKQCYFSAILCILAKVKMNVNDFRGTILDEFIMAGDKIYQLTGKLRYKPVRWFYNLEIIGTKCNVILKQAVYADPENYEEDNLSRVLTSYLARNQTGILIFDNMCYAFWWDDNYYYIFDPYGCDDKGLANESGFCCLLRFSTLTAMIKRIEENAGEATKKPYRIHSMTITHMKLMKKKRKRKKNKKEKKVLCVEEKVEEESEESAAESEHSVIELVEWLDSAKRVKPKSDLVTSAFAALSNFNASVLEVIVLENDITTPILTDFKVSSPRKRPRSGNARRDSPGEFIRKKPYNRRFHEGTAIAIPIDLCIMAWACIHDPTLWGTKTVKAIYEASRDFAQDCLLAMNDTTVSGTIDKVLPEFNIGNYTFKIVFSELHNGVLYATEGWNLAMSLKKVFDAPIYTGAILICGKSHIGVMKKEENYYAWWVVPRTKYMKIVTSEEFEEILKLVVTQINEREEVIFVMRAVTISYARKFEPDCADTTGLHETIVPATSLAEIHRKQGPLYDVETLFRKITPSTEPVFVQGSVALRNRDSLKEPKMKRCYFVAVLALMVKRDIVQNTVMEMIDKIIEVAEELYKEFDEPKYHTEHILRNVSVMNRMFEFRDCASPLVTYKEEPDPGKQDRFILLRKFLKRHLNKYNGGMIHFSNGCYAFWHSRTTKSFYYLDPYQCNAKGKRVDSGGKSCLCIFPRLCQMAKHICQNQFKDTTSFFIHTLHVESINVPPFEKFQEDPMWVYLDFHWSFSHAPRIARETETKKGKTSKEKIPKESPDNPTWNNYVIEIPNLVYSLWGTLGCYDSRFGERAGRNQVGICVAVIAMQYLCHPSRWGPAILDSAVICGDSYYTESLRSAARNKCRHSNRFNLQHCFKIFPYIWRIEYRENMCGTLYGGRNRLTLAATLKLAFEKELSLLIECCNATFSVISVEDGYYVADPRWTGPPLFSRNHGALYVLRCRNMNALVYALTKMFNTNQKMEFHITPVTLDFSQELCRIGNEKSKKKILMDSVNARPGIACDWNTIGSCSMNPPNEDSYLLYQKNLVLGIKHGDELEHPKMPSLEPAMKRENFNNAVISTKWHLNVGRPTSKRGHGLLSSNHNIEKKQKVADGITDFYRMLSTDKQLEVQNYPRIIDFIENDTAQFKKSVPRPNTWQISNKYSSKKPLPSPVEPMECTASRSFLLEENRKIFRKQERLMADEVFKTYVHRVPKRNTDDNDNNQDSEDKNIDKVENTDVERSIPPDEEKENTETETGTEGGTSEAE